VIVCSAVQAPRYSEIPARISNESADGFSRARLPISQNIQSDPECPQVKYLADFASRRGAEAVTFHGAADPVNYQTCPDTIYAPATMLTDDPHQHDQRPDAEILNAKEDDRAHGNYANPRRFCKLIFPLCAVF
jgi:hypothetical protein